MKKALSLLILFLPILCLARSPYDDVTNMYTWSNSVTSSNDIAWQIYNSTDNSKTIYIDDIDMATEEGGYFTVYSTNVGNGFTGTRVSGTAKPTLIGLGGTSISSVTYCADASLPTGDPVWQGIGSSTSTISSINYVFGVKPGFAIYIIKTNGAAGEKSAASFHFREEPR